MRNSSVIPTGIPTRALARFVSPAQAFGGPRTDAVQVWTGEPVVSFPCASDADVVTAVERAREGQAEWWALPVRHRIDTAMRLARLIDRHREKLMRVLQVFGGQSRFDAYDQFQDAYNSAAQYAQFMRQYARPTYASGVFPLISRLRRDRLPLGVVGAFTLADYPLSYGTVDILPILAAGNAVVQFVPAQAYPVAMAVRELACSAGIPDRAWQILPSLSTHLGRRHLGRFDHVMYVGNTADGVALTQACLDESVSTTTFMSVKNHAVVLSDANLEVAVRSVAWQAFMNAGYSSVHIEKVHIDRAIYPQFVEKLCAFIGDRIVLGATYDHRATMGSAYSQGRLDRVCEHVEDAISLGAHVLCGGNARPDIGPWFHEPTVLANVPEEALAFGEETYGPILIVSPFSAIDEVISEMAQSQYCYAMQIFTHNMRLAHAVSRSSTAGFVSVNDGYHMLWGAWNAPIQGGRDTGNGIRHGAASVEQYMRSCLTLRQVGTTGEPGAEQSMEQWEQMSARRLKSSAILHSLLG